MTPRALGAIAFAACVALSWCAKARPQANAAWTSGIAAQTVARSATNCASRDDRRPPSVSTTHAGAPAPAVANSSARTATAALTASSQHCNRWTADASAVSAADSHVAGSVPTTSRTTASTFMNSR